MLEASSQKSVVIGAKQVIKSLRTGMASKLYIASDCDPAISDPLVKEAADREIAVGYVPTRKQLGEMCGIRVRAAAAAIIKI